MTATIRDPSTDVKVSQSPRKRRRWRRRILYGLVGVVVVLSATRLVAGWLAQRHLQAALEAYRAAGEPVFPSDLNAPHIPDEENAAILYLEAHQQLTTNPAIEGMLVGLGNRPAASIEQAVNLRELSAAGESTIRLAEAAFARPRANWQTPITSPMVSFFPEFPRRQFRLCELMTCSALWFHKTGDDAKAFRLLRNALHAADCLGEYRGYPMVFFFAASVDRSVASAIEHITPRLSERDRRVSRIEIETLLRELMNEKKRDEAWVNSLDAERVQVLEVMQEFYEGRLHVGRLEFESFFEMILRPAWDVDLVRLLDSLLAARRAGLAGDWLRASRMLPPVCKHSHGFWSELADLIHLPTSELQTDIVCDNTLRLRFRAVLHRRMAAMRLALCLYEMDNGKRPASLGELVPRYLAALPEDPLAPDHRTFGYRNEGMTLLLYSVGWNGLDEQGDFVLRLTEKGVDETETARDIPFFLAGNRPQVPQANKQGASDQQHVGDGARAFLQAEERESLRTPPRCADVEAAIRNIISKHASNRKVEMTRTTNLAKDLGFDELDVIAIVVDVEDRFAITIPDEVTSELETVGQLIDYVLIHGDEASKRSAQTSPGE